MKSGGQRQDVAFLALAVAVLAVAVALFVGMKAIQKPRPNKPEAKPEKQAKVAGPLVQKPTGGPRDPFKTQGGATAARGGPAGAPGGPAAQTLKLVGIVTKQGEPPVAIIHSTKKRYYARVGERAAGYTVVTIAPNEVVLEKDGARMTLLLRQPETEEE
jgi:hypothetical protein